MASNVSSVVLGLFDGKQFITRNAGQMLLSNKSVVYGLICNICDIHWSREGLDLYPKCYALVANGGAASDMASHAHVQVTVSIEMNTCRLLFSFHRARFFPAANLRVSSPRSKPGVSRIFTVSDHWRHLPNSQCRCPSSTFLFCR